MTRYCFIKFDLEEIIRLLPNAYYKLVRKLALLLKDANRVCLVNHDGEHVMIEDMYQIQEQLAFSVRENFYRRKSLEFEVINFLKLLNSFGTSIYILYKKKRRLNRSDCEKKAVNLFYGWLDYQLEFR